MPNKGKFIGSQDNLFVPDAPTIGTATAGNTEVSVAFTAPSDVGNDAITLYGASVFLAGATINYKVSVGTGTLSTGGSGNVYFIDGIPTKTLSLIKGFTYVFDLSDGSNSGHPFGFKNASDGAYTTGVTTSGTAGSASATVTLVLATDASEPSRYYCTSHGNGMGNTISLIEASASTDPLGAAQAGATGSSSPITVTGLTNSTSYIAKVWAINDYGNGPLSAATDSFTPVLDRMLYAGGRQSTTENSDTVQYINGSSTGNATDFGNLSAGRQLLSSVASSTRGVVGGGHPTSQSNVVDIIEYFTFATTGNATDFGNLTVARNKGAGFGSGTRGIFAGGSNSSNVEVNTIDYITIASAGDATDFGDINVGTRYNLIGGFASPTRGVFAGGYNQNIIQYLTIASAGNTTDFGDLTVKRWEVKGCSTSTRGLFMGGFDDSTRHNVIDYVTIASTGNATDFGNLSADKREGASASNSTRGMYFGGETSATQGDGLNVIEYVTIASTGNVTDFGDLLAAGEEATACSSTHGGIA